MKIIKFTNSNDDTVIKQVHNEILDGEWNYGDLDEVHIHDGKFVEKQFSKHNLEKLDDEVIREYKPGEYRIKSYVGERGLANFNKALQNWVNNK